MNSLLEGTSRLAQMAFLLACGAVVVTACSAVITGAGKFGPLLFVVAGGMALWSFMRDRDDFGMWPAYATFPIVLIGLVLSLPLLMNTRGHGKIAIDAQYAREDFTAKRQAFEHSLPICTRDNSAGYCSANSIASTSMSKAAGLKAEQNCTAPSSACISDAGAGYLLEFVTREIRPIGELRYEESRTMQNKLVSTTCRALNPHANGNDVRAACGPGVAVVVG